MTYAVHWQESALDDLLELPKHVAGSIVRKVENHLAQEPRKLGLALSAPFSGLYRYRVGDYRVIYEIMEQEVRIHVVRVGHRKDVYDA